MIISPFINDVIYYHEYKKFRLVRNVATFVTALVIFVEEDEQTEWFAKANLTGEAEFENVSIIKDETNTVSASFKSGKNQL